VALAESDTEAALEMFMLAVAVLAVLIDAFITTAPAPEAVNVAVATPPLVTAEPVMVPRPAPVVIVNITVVPSATGLPLVSTAVTVTIDVPLP